MRAAKGVSAGECFNSVDGDATPSEEQVEQYNISCESARSMRPHHAGHIGMPMALKEAGVMAEDAVRVVDFDGIRCFAVELRGESGAVSDPYWEGTGSLYINPHNYAVRGRLWQSERLPPQYFVAVGELDVNGVRMPQVKLLRRTRRHAPAHRRVLVRGSVEG